ncbi:MAG TPA: DUF4389 domain-containing protein [Vicinamibacterales bacterium]|nr:DUF4389 domain-containing protein [Vicinamibacterales bacterium]
MAYPVSVTVEPPAGERNRLTTACRLILAIPHFLLIGGLGASFTTGNGWAFGSEGGVLGAVVVFLAVVSWFTILLTGTHIAGIRELSRFYLRWRVRALAYAMLLEDAYPPFGEGSYRAGAAFVEPALPRNKMTVGFRLILAIPHFCVLFILTLAWGVTAFIGWLLIVATGAYPKGLHEFGVGTLRWHIRVEAYMLLLVDDYPPFSLD